MKKIILIIAMFVAMPSYATTMCTANDTVAVVLDPSISITGYKNDNDAGTWSAWSAQGTFHGIGTCLNRGYSRGSWTAVPRLTDTDNNGNTNLVAGSERYGRYCWCKLTHPVTSLWTFFTDEWCGSCPYYCAYYFYANSNARRVMFNSVAQ